MGCDEAHLLCKFMEGNRWVPGNLYHGLYKRLKYVRNSFGNLIYIQVGHQLIDYTHSFLLDLVVHLTIASTAGKLSHVWAQLPSKFWDVKVIYVGLVKLHVSKHKVSSSYSHIQGFIQLEYACLSSTTNLFKSSSRVAVFASFPKEACLSSYFIAKDPEGLDSDRWIPLRGGARIPSGILATPRVRDSPIWIQPRGVFRFNPIPGS